MRQAATASLAVDTTAGFQAPASGDIFLDLVLACTVRPLVRSIAKNSKALSHRAETVEIARVEIKASAACRSVLCAGCKFTPNHEAHIDGSQTKARALSRSLCPLSLALVCGFLLQLRGLMWRVQ